MKKNVLVAVLSALVIGGGDISFSNDCKCTTRGYSY